MGANPNISNKVRALSFCNLHIAHRRFFAQNGETPVIIAQGEDKREILDLLQSCARPIVSS